MDVEYTDVEVCANFAEVLRRVGAGDTVVVLRDGEAVAEIRLPRDKRIPGETWHDYLVRTGQLKETGVKWDPKPGVRVEGALERFLKDRG